MREIRLYNENCGAYNYILVMVQKRATEESNEFILLLNKIEKY